MIGILFGAWVFCLVSFCAGGMGCRVACHKRRIQGRTCICGRHEVAVKAVAPGFGHGLPGVISGRPSRLRAAESRVRALQERFIEGRLAMEQYETTLETLKNKI